MQLLPLWVLPHTMPSVYERDSFTAIEMVAKVYGAMNELIKEYNQFAETANKRMADFEAETEEQFNLFAVGLRQEFEDFIGVVDLKIKEMQQTIEDIDNIALNAVQKVINAGGVAVEEQYDQASETLNIEVRGG